MIDADELADRHDRLYELHRGELGHRRTSTVCVLADAAYLRTHSGQVCWATLLNLVARLYKGIERLRITIDPGIERLPGVFFPNDLGDIREASFKMLEDLHGGPMAVEEGPAVADIEDGIVVCVGAPVATAPVTAITIAGRGWVAYLNDDAWISVADDQNALGPMAAAALGTGQIYRRLYSNSGTKPERLVFSAFRNAEPALNPPMPRRIHLPRTFVPGAGAVGMSFLAALHCMAGIVSSDGLFIIDEDRIDASNLNRCLVAILADLVADDGGPLHKIDILKARLAAKRLNLQTYPRMWEKFVEQPEFKNPHLYELVVSCVDKYDARKAVQFAKQPRLLLTAGTGDFLLSVSRHRLDDGMSCGLCYQLRDRPPTCDTASEGAQHAFEKLIDPSIGFVSALAGVLLAAEYVKEIHPEWHGDRVNNTARLYVLSGKFKAGRRTKDPACNCSSKYVILGYQDAWGG